MKKTPSLTKAKQLLKDKGDKKSLDIVKEKIKKQTTITGEVYWKAVRYHIKQIIKNR